MRVLFFVISISLGWDLLLLLLSLLPKSKQILIKTLLLLLLLKRIDIYAFCNREGGS